MMKKTDSNLPGIGFRAVVCSLLVVAALSFVPHVCAAEGERPQPTEQEMALAEELIGRIIERYESERSYRISFTQESYWALGDTTISSNGVIVLERPSMMSVRYDDGSMIASQGETLTVYMSQTNQYFVTPIGPDDTVIDPPRVLRSFLPDPEGPFSERFADVEKGTDRNDWFERTVEATLMLLPADRAGEPARLEVTVDPSRGVVTGMVARTRSGDSTHYRVLETSFGVETKPADFAITIPAGAERIGG